MLKKFVSIFSGDPNKRTVSKYAEVVEQVNPLEAQFEALTDEQLRSKTSEFRSRLIEGETFDDLMIEAFTAVREASKRTLGLRHYDVQLIGGAVLHEGTIAEMRTGEGKTLVATLPLYLNALAGKGAHLITVNDYLARRDARWMAPIYHALGMSVGVLQMAARTENGKKAFLIDLERTSPHEDQHQLRMVPRKEAYSADITYGTNSEFGFDYLRDNMTMRLDDRVQRGHYYAIVDEVDNVLIDEARTPLIISGPATDDTEWYTRMAQIVRQLRSEDYEINEKDRNVTLSEIGETHVEELLGIPLRDPDRPEDVTPEQARLVGYLEQALRAQFLFKRNKDYLVTGGKVIIIDEFTGRQMPGRRWSDGLHQAVEAKEGARVQAENVTYATITIQNYFRMYEKLAGMSGTAITEAEEFHKIYKLEVSAIPTNLEYQAVRAEAALVELESKDDLGYKYRYYTHKEDPLKAPVFWKRKDYPDVIYRTEEAKFRALTREILQCHALGRPVLVGTTSVELSERLSNRLKAEPLRRMAQVLMLRHAWFERNHQQEDGRQVAELAFLNEPLDKLDLSAIRKMARDLETAFIVEDARKLLQDSRSLSLLETVLNLPAGNQERLVASLQAGIPHQVLNARKHTEESQIIAGAGAFGSITIATNMAGRGVDIKLGGELAEEVLSVVNRVLRRAGVNDPYDLTMEERWGAVRELQDPDYGIYEAEVQFFLKHMEDMQRVKELGGLHVIGSERHEARRIDNQLRGRSARQGDPGSSRFYLSMEDELMRLFGGQQADSLMQRMHIDDALPLEVGIVGRIVEQSQTRVEGANFDVRKHLLEYDDVLNSQRSRIYEQRDRIFTKDDLSEDVSEMLRAEIERRVPEAMKDPEGPWKLVAWLDQIQPPLDLGSTLFPSFTLKLLLERVLENKAGLQSPQDIRHALVSLARQALGAEQEHLLLTVKNLFESTWSRLEVQQKESQDTLDAFFEGFKDEDEAAQRGPRELADELSGLLRVPLRLTPEQQRSLRSDPDAAKNVVGAQVDTALQQQAITRMLGAVERRLEEMPELDAGQLAALDWDQVEEQVTAAVESLLEKRQSRLVGEGDQIGKDLEASLAKLSGSLRTDHLVALLMMMPQGSRSVFDKKTHRRVRQHTTRLTYIFLAAELLKDRDAEQLTQDVLEHLEKAQRTLRAAYGLNLWPRLANATWADLETATQAGLREALSEESCASLQSQPLQSLDTEQIKLVIDLLGRRALTEIYRQLLLAVISELWVDYLTQMEALRVSIGLEAYAQRDPLVQYKSRASELFSNLLREMRQGVAVRMFTYRPRDTSGLQVGLKRTSGIRQDAAEVESDESEAVVEEIELGGELSGDGEQEVDHEPVAQEESGLSRSQKRRRRRR
jgi:preprotein translocase subunit SecA